MNKSKLRTCQVCGNDFPVRHGGGRKGNKVCGPECRIESIRTAKLRGALFPCDWCGKDVWKRPSQQTKRNYCDAGCVRREQESRRITYECEVCGKSVTRTPAQAAARYCSRPCQHVGQRRRVTLECAMCGTPFEVKQSEASERKNCSTPCSRRYFLEVVQFNRASSGTKPELAFEEFLGDRGKRTSDNGFFINFASGRIKNPDFVLYPYRERRVVEIFGSYWHPPDEEKELIALYAEVGYRCLVIWDHELDDGSYRDKFYQFLGC